MLDVILRNMLADADLTPDQAARVQEGAALAVAQMGPLDMLVVAGRLMSAKAAIDAGDTGAGMAMVTDIAAQYGLSDLIADLAAELAPAQPPALAPGD